MGVVATAIQRVQPGGRIQREGCCVEHRRAELQAEPRDAARDNSARFLRELRQLRGGAGLGQAELAARAHYPCDAIRAAEAGPSLPDLPVLSAYVRGCGGTLAEWEERWRSLTRSPAMPLLPVRPAGSSDAASAGARIGSTSLAADGHDPGIIMAALGRVADGMAASAQAASPAGAGRSKPPTAPAPAAMPMAAAAAGPKAAHASVAPGAVARRDASVALAAPGAGPAAGAAPGSGAASRAAVPSAVPPLPASSQVVAGKRRVLPPRTVAAALVAALAVGVIATVVVVVVAVLALFA
jgi:Helix-turn-helix domain